MAKISPFFVSRAGAGRVQGQQIPSYQLPDAAGAADDSLPSPVSALPPGATVFAQPLNIGAQPTLIDKTADTSTTQVAIVTPDGAVAVMNMGTFISKIIEAETADKATTEQLGQAVSQTQAALAAQKKATDDAIDEVNKAIAGQGSSLSDTINKISAQVTANAAAITQNTADIAANKSQIAANSASITALQATCDSLQAQINALKPAA